MAQMILEAKSKTALKPFVQIARERGVVARYVAATPQPYEKRNDSGAEAVALFRDIRQGVIDAGETMTTDEINSDIAKYRREKRAVRERAVESLSRIRQHSVEAGLNKMTLKEINGEIAQARRERTTRCNV